MSPVDPVRAQTPPQPPPPGRSLVDQSAVAVQGEHVEAVVIDAGKLVVLLGYGRRMKYLRSEDVREELLEPSDSVTMFELDGVRQERPFTPWSVSARS